ncbi:MAG: YebC/PmpR family DNA-binding transcriptional regulator [Dehalococcoidia bacterium]|nr:YebC/PmpR family DNA-binding transcriptional regulator [Dehalococcoidia bacterium]
MSGHSKWSTIKHKKGAADAKRGQLFTKLAREIMVAARGGDPDPDMNFRLRLAIDNAKSLNMPKDNIDRAVARGSGVGDDSVILEEISYEAYGPGGAGIIVQALTDNKNRTAAEVRAQITRAGGNLAGAGAVSWNFENKGLITLVVDDGDPDDVALEIVDTGAEDVDVEGSTVEVTAPFEGFAQVKTAVESLNGITVERAELALVPTSLVSLDNKTSMQTLRLLDALEDVDDVSKVYSNADFPDEALEKYAED